MRTKVSKNRQMHKKIRRLVKKTEILQKLITEIIEKMIWNSRKI